jgi:prepilin-type N-terminal cleavage/methylation domain-containing protein
MHPKGPRPRPRSAEQGFTLVETLVAIVVLVFGLIAVTNLLLVAASSNTVANQGTAAVTSSTRVMDLLKQTSFANLAPGGQAWEAPPGGGKACGDPTLVVTDWHCTDDIPGVGSIHTHWWITATADPRLVYINTQSQGLGSLAAERSRALFTTLRSCTDSDAASGGCPQAPAGGQVLP